MIKNYGMNDAYATPHTIIISGPNSEGTHSAHECSGNSHRVDERNKPDPMEEGKTPSDTPNSMEHNSLSNEEILAQTIPMIADILGLISGIFQVSRDSYMGDKSSEEIAPSQVN